MRWMGEQAVLLCAEGKDIGYPEDFMKSMFLVFFTQRRATVPYAVYKLVGWQDPYPPVPKVARHDRSMTVSLFKDDFGLEKGSVTVSVALCEALAEKIERANLFVSVPSAIWRIIKTVKR